MFYCRIYNIVGKESTMYIYLLHSRDTYVEDKGVVTKCQSSDTAVSAGDDEVVGHFSMERGAIII